MRVQVVTVVMRVCMLVRDRFMVVPVGVFLHQVKRDAGHHQDTAQHQTPAARPIPEDPRQGRAHKRRESVHGAGAGRAE